MPQMRAEKTKHMESEQMSEVKVLDRLHELMPTDEQANSSNAQKAVKDLLSQLVQEVRDKKFNEPVPAPTAPLEPEV